MAHLKSETYVNNENRGQFAAFVTKNPNETARKHHTVKKQAFGELKNVMHNQCLPRALKFDDVAPKAKQPNKHAEINVTNKALKKVASVFREPQCEDKIEILNYFDFNGGCYAKPYKSDRQIWSEMNMFNDSFIDKIMEGAQHDEKKPDATVEKMFDDSEPDDLLDFNSSKLFSTLHIDNGSDDLLLPPPAPPILGFLSFDDL